MLLVFLRMILLQSKNTNQSKKNESTVGSANGSITLKKSINEGFEKGYDLSKKITKKESKISKPTSNERTYGEKDKFFCQPGPL